MRALLIGLVASSFHAAHAGWELPLRARGGKAAEKLGLNRRQVSDSSPLTWQAQVDNFSAQDNRTYAQRYYINDQYYDPVNGPIFLNIGGEYTLSGPPTG